MPAIPPPPALWLIPAAPADATQSDVPGSRALPLDRARTPSDAVAPMEDIAEVALSNNPRYKPEPSFAKTGVGILLPATPEERAQELMRNQELIERLKQRQRESVEKGAEGKAR